MSMYALQVMTGMEAEITQKLRGKGVDARCPQERRMIRRGGKWQEQLYTLFPSYIFVSTPDVYRVYYAVRHEDGVLHWLGATKGTPEALSAHEEANILWLAGDGPAAAQRGRDAGRRHTGLYQRAAGSLEGYARKSEPP